MEILFIFLQHSERKIKRLQWKAGIAPKKKAHCCELLNSSFL